MMCGPVYKQPPLSRQCHLAVLSLHPGIRGHQPAPQHQLQPHSKGVRRCPDSPWFSSSESSSLPGAPTQTSDHPASGLSLSSLQRTEHPVSQSPHAQNPLLAPGHRLSSEWFGPCLSNLSPLTPSSPMHPSPHTHVHTSLPNPAAPASPSAPLSATHLLLDAS